jgi:hypothetical protein
VPSSGHHARRLTPAEIDRFDRWADVCGTAPRCRRQATCQLSYTYTTGRWGRTAQAHKHACTMHADKFATKHHITIAAAPTTEPSTPGVIAAAAAAWSPGPITQVTIRPSGTRFVTTCYSRHGTVQSGTCWLDNIPPGLQLHEATGHAEQAIARQYRLVPTGPWHLDDLTARAPVAAAEHTDAWAAARWAVCVSARTTDDDARLSIWYAEALLDTRFRAETWGLGHTNMDLARAVRTATAEMTDEWDLGEWTIHDNNTATATAHRRRVTADAA